MADCGEERREGEWCGSQCVLVCCICTSVLRRACHSVYVGSVLSLHSLSHRLAPTIICSEFLIFPRIHSSSPCRSRRINFFPHGRGTTHCSHPEMPLPPACPASEDLVYSSSRETSTACWSQCGTRTCIKRSIFIQQATSSHVHQDCRFCQRTSKIWSCPTLFSLRLFGRPPSVQCR